MVYDITVKAICNYTFVQTHRVSKTKSESEGELCALGYDDASL